MSVEAGFRINHPKLKGRVLLREQKKKGQYILRQIELKFGHGLTWGAPEDTADR
jgi:hypothetical protein